MRTTRAALASCLALPLLLALAACGPDEDENEDPAGSTERSTDVEELAPLSEESTQPPTWLEETGEPRESPSGLCTDPFAAGSTELDTTELAACQAESLAEVAGYVQTTDAGPGASTVLRVSNEDGLAVEADIGVAHVLVVGEDWWASTDGEEWLEPEAAAEVTRLNGVEGAATSLQLIHDPASAAGTTQPYDLAVTGSASVDGTEVAVLTGTGEGADGSQVDITFHVTRDYVVLRGENAVTSKAGDAVTRTAISELDEPQVVEPPA